MNTKTYTSDAIKFNLLHLKKRFTLIIGLVSFALMSQAQTVTINSGSNTFLGGANYLTPTTMAIELNGGALNAYKSGSATTGYSQTFGTLDLSASSTINLATGNTHTLTFAASNAVSWTASTTLTINNWVGTPEASGTKGQLFVGSGSTGLTANQLSQITFDISGVSWSATILSTGEIVPAYKIYRSKQTGNWSVATNWEYSVDGTNWYTATVAPSSSDGTITIRNSHTITVNGAITIDQVTVDAGGQVTHSASNTVTLNNGTGTDLMINGTWKRTSSSSISISSGAAIAVGSGGIYEHAIGASGGTIPTATWDANSTLLLTPTATMSSYPDLSTQNFGKIEINCASQTLNYILCNFTQVQTEVKIVSTGTGSIELQNSSIQGNYVQTGGTVFLGYSPFSSYTTQVNGTFDLQGGTFNMNYIGSTYYAQLIVDGDFTQSGGTFNFLPNSISGPGYLDLKSDMTLSGGAFTTSFTIANTGVYFVGPSATQTLTISNLSSFTSALNTRFYYKTSSGPSAINEVYSSTTLGAQTAVSGTTSTSRAGYAAWPTSGTLINNFTVNNASGVSLASSREVNGILYLTNGILTTTSSNSMTISNTATTGINGGSTTNFVSGPLSRKLPASLSTSSSVYTFPVGKSTTYYPFSLTSLTTSASSPNLTVEAFNSNAGGAVGTLTSLSTTEYWKTNNTNSVSATSVSLTRQAALGSLNVIATSNTVTGTYTTLGGTVSGTSITGSNSTSLNAAQQYFLMANYGCVNPTSGGTIATAQTICTGGDPAAFTSTASPSGNTGTLEYKWQSSTTSNSAGFSDIALATSATYDAPSGLTQTTWYKRLSKVTCSATWAAAGESNVIEVTVNALPTTSNAGADQTGVSTCGLTSITLAGNTATTGTGAWSIVSGTGGTVTTPSSPTSTFSGTAGSSYTLQWTISNGSCSTSSDQVAITFNQNPTVSTSVTETSGTANDGTVCSGTSVTLSGTGATTYSWNNSVTDGGAFTPSSTTTYTVTGTTSGCTATSTRLITVNNPTIAAGITLANNDLVWRGATSSDWTNTGNWLIYNSTTSSYSVPNSAPSTSTPVIIPAYGQACVPTPPTIAGTVNSDNVTIQSGATLTIGSGGILNLSGSLSNAGTLTYAAAGTVNVEGGWVNNGTFNAGSGTVVFNGTTNASIISGTNSFYNLSLNGGSALEVTLSNAVTVTNTLTLTTGKVILGANNLTIGASGAISGGSSSSFVVTNSTGVLKQQSIDVSAAAGKKVFPIGLSTASYTPMILANAGTSDDFSARVTSGVLQSGTSGSAITTKYINRTWLIDETSAGGSNATLTLGWNAAEEQGQFTRTACFVTHYTGGSWDLSTATSASGNPYTTFRSGITSFSPFTVTSTSALPIELISFQANCSDNNTVDITWSTASEHNTNYFRVDKSRNGTQWDVLNTVGAAGNSTNVIDYSLTDFFPTPGINYYRLTQYDNDGVFETFDAQAAVCKDQQGGTALSSYPNPSTSDFNIDLETDELEGEAVLTISDAKGAIVHSQDIKIVKGNNNYIIEKFNAEPGMYYITVKAGNSSVTTKHSMR